MLRATASPAAAVATCSSVVLPMPAAPRTTTRPPPPSRAPWMTAWTAASSRSRPIIEEHCHVFHEAIDVDRSARVQLEQLAVDRERSVPAALEALDQLTRTASIEVPGVPVGPRLVAREQEVERCVTVDLERPVGRQRPKFG